MHKIKLLNGILSVLLLIGITGCEKYLAVKPDQALVTPASIADARALMDSYSENQNRYAVLAHSSNDDYFVSEEVLAGLNETDRGIYLFTIRQENLLQSIWLGGYGAINRANLVFDFLGKYQATANELQAKNDCLGHAYFLRALRHFNLALFYTEPYLQATTAKTPGLPIRQTADVSEPTTRGTLEDTYNFIEQDLKMAIDLLPNQPSAYFRPGKAAANSLLAWVMMHMQRFEEALVYAETALAIKSDLMDYNSINPGNSISFARYNAEVLFQAQISGNSLLSFNNWKVDSNLYRSYAANDLRQGLYFRTNGTNTFGFKGDYNGAIAVDQFAGITTGETYMIAAEAAARLGQVQKAMDRLNALLVKRFRSGTFIPFKASNADEAFKIIRDERRKEFAGRGLRWFDLRRWNYEGVTAIEITRKYTGIMYSLGAKSKNYVFEIPAGVIAMTGIEQNERE